jgi:hypothetical protein
MPEPTHPTSHAAERSPRDALSQIINGYQTSQAIFVAVRLGIVDLLKEASKSSEELAASAGVNAQALYRLLRVLASTGVLHEVEPRHFALTPMGALLQTGNALRATAIMQAELYWPAYGELLYAVQTGRSAFERAFGMSIYDYLANHPEADAAYTANMTVATGRIATALTTAYDFSGISTVVDVGGGQGALLAEILKTSLHLRGILCDRPVVVAGARNVLEAQGVADRCDIASGNFLEAVPAGGDAYILKWVISDWADDQAVVILKNCHRAMNAHGRVLVIDPVDLPTNASFNLNMFVVWSGGGVRSVADLRALFEAAGFSMERIIPTQSQFSIVEGRQM